MLITHVLTQCLTTFITHACQVKLLHEDAQAGSVLTQLGSTLDGPLIFQ